METIEQVNEDFNVKKPKKKGLIIGAVVAVAIVIAFILVYSLVLSNPKFIFGKAIDKLLAVDSQKYDSIKMDTKIKASVELEDESMQTQLAEIEKCTLKAGVQMDVGSKQEIVDLGLEYDNQEVIDAQVYYNEGEMYAYFDGLFDKYIELDIDEETKAQLDKIFETATSEENLKNTEKAIEIVKDELKAQIKEKGKFEKDKATIDIGEDEEKTTKITVKLTEKQLYNIAENILTDLAKNDDFLDCFEESPKDLLKEAADEIKDLEGNNKNNVKISLYTKGLLNNKLVATDVEIYSADDESTINATVVKENKATYSYKATVKSSGIKMDLIKGKVEIEKDKDSKKEQSGKTTITAEVIEFGDIKLEIDYSAEFNKGIDQINTANSINMNDLTETDLQSVITKLKERPLIGDIIENLMNTNEQNDFTDDSETEVNIINTLTTTQNEVKDKMSGYSVAYSVPVDFEYKKDFSNDEYKYYELMNEDYSNIQTTVSINWNTETDYVEDEINWDYNYYQESEFYKNVNLSDTKTIGVGDKTFKYKILSYEWASGETTSVDQNIYVWYPLDDEYMFTVELEVADTEITEDIIKGFLNINVTELN